MRCQSASDLSSIDIFCITCLQTHSPPFWLLFLYFQDASCYCLCQHAVYSSDKPSAEVVCFSSTCHFPWHAASHGGALPIIWCTREAQREPLPTAQRRSLCVFAPGSFSARCRIMGRAERGRERVSSLALLIIHLANWLAPLCDQQ